MKFDFNELVEKKEEKNWETLDENFVMNFWNS